jgi:hypothetical protein
VKRVVWLGILTILVVVVALILLLVSRQQRLARSFMAELQTVRVGSGDLQVMRELRDKCGPGCSQSSEHCDQDSCELIFRFDNSPLWQLRAAPLTHLGGSVTLHRNVIDYETVVYRVSCGRELWSGADIAQFPASQAEAPFQSSVGPAGGKPPFLRVRMTSAASPEQRSKAFDLNLSCLSRLGGCSGASELAPSLASGQVLSCGTSPR